MTAAVLFFLLGLALTLGLTALILKTSFARGLLDRPNHRSSHSQPTPRIGGICLVLGALCSCLVFTVTSQVPLSSMSLYTLIALSMVSALGLFDDRFSLAAGIRLTIQLLIAGFIAWLIWQGGYFEGASQISIRSLTWTAIVSLGVVALLITTSTNFFNFMDGINGLVGLFCAWGLGVLGLIAPDKSMSVVALSLSGASFGFLFFNWGKAKVFMGDAGSTTLGFFVGTLAIWGSFEGYWHWTLPSLIFAPLLLDALLTLLRRIFQGERFWEAHRSHVYQRLTQMGWSHQRVALVFNIFGFIGLLISSSLNASSSLVRLVVAILWLFFIASLLIVTSRWINDKSSR